MEDEKLITFAVPCYNSAAYMRNCIDTLITAGEAAQVVVVNDGSSDDTGAIADEYAAKYPSIVEVVHKENGGHGSGVNAGLDRARGLYFKVVDSDDRLDPESLAKLLATVRGHIAKGTLPDMYLTNYVYEKPSASMRYPRRYSKNFPKDKVFGWEETKPFYFSNVLLMHSMVVRTQVLRDCGLRLPEHSFYVDNIFAYQPLPYIKTLFYLNADLYRYYIGRVDQSVSRKNIIDRYKQQVGVTDIMIRCHRYADLEKLTPRLKKYMKHDLNVLITLSVMFTTGGRGESVKERKATLKRMWSSIKEEDRAMYRFLRHRTYVALINWMPYSWQRFFTTLGYYYFKNKLNCS